MLCSVKRVGDLKFGGKQACEPGAFIASILVADDLVKFLSIYS